MREKFAKYAIFISYVLILAYLGIGIFRSPDEVGGQILLVLMAFGTFLARHELSTRLAMIAGVLSVAHAAFRLAVLWREPGVVMDIGYLLAALMLLGGAFVLMHEARISAAPAKPAPQVESERPDLDSH